MGRRFAKFLGFSSVLKAEAWGFLEGLQLALDIEVDSLEIECDNATLVGYVQGRCDPGPNLAVILTEIRRALACVCRWSISHCWREANHSADFLASFGASLMSVCDALRFEAPPAGLGALLIGDTMGGSSLRDVRVSCFVV